VTLTDYATRFFALDRTIRFAGVIDKMSKISLQEACARGGRSHLIQRRTGASCTLRLPLGTRCNRTLIPSTGGSHLYAVRAGEDKKITSFPIGENLVLVSNDKKGAHGRIIGKILNLIAAAD
jgi:hypothetical protein